MPSITAPTKKITTLSVAVKCRPLTCRELGRDIVRVHNDKEVLVLDPDLSKDYLDRIQNRTKERGYTFDYAFGPNSTNLDVYKRSVRSTIAGVVQGLNATVFAYGSTGRSRVAFDKKLPISCNFQSEDQVLKEKTLTRHVFMLLKLCNIYSLNIQLRAEPFRNGKTYTMVGTRDDPGLMVLSLNTIFDLMEKDDSSDYFEVTCSYLEVYNEVIYDLLEKSSGHLELREDPEQGIIVAGLRSIKVNSADRILELLNLGNSRRKTESTEVNETSSRSHAVLEITVKRKQQKKYPNQVIKGKLALVDLAGSERASETNSGGQKLRDGANINRSLLALANCINALGKQQKKGLAYVPYRNSKLTRILKDGLSGNSQTIMIATISPADNQYHHTVNTLKYADRAKEIKTHIQKNVGTINAHVSDYQKMIDNLQGEVSRLRNELAEKESQLNAKSTEKAVDDEISLVNALSLETNENVQERINLQKALIELEETNVRNRKELQHLDDAIAKQQAIENDAPVVQALQARRQVILDNIRDNDELGVNYQKEIEANEKRRCQLQNMIDEAIENNGNKSYLGILSQYRLLGMTNTELQFQMAIRDQIIYSQREAHRKLWDLLMSLGLGEKQIEELGAKQGITVDDIKMITPGPSNMTHSPNLMHEKYTPQHFNSQSGVASPGFFPQEQEFGARSFSAESQTPTSALFREEHHASYYYISHGISPPVNQSWCNNQPTSYFGTADQPPHGLDNSFQHRSNHIPHYDKSGVSNLSFNTNFRQHQRQQDAWLVANGQQVNMTSYAGINRTWDPSKDVVTTPHGERTPGVFGRFRADQGANKVNPQHGYPKAPARRPRQTVAGMLPSHITSKFKGEQYKCK